MFVIVIIVDRRLALAKYKGRLTEFEIKGDEDLIPKAERVIKLANRTIFEVLFLEGLFLSLSDLDNAVTLLNTHITGMSGKVSQDDIEHNLWQYVSKVLRGERLQ